MIRHALKKTNKKNKQIILTATVQNRAILGKPVESQMFCLGEKNPVMQLIQWSPPQFKVLS